MELRWTSGAVGDLARLHQFLSIVNKDAAARAVQSLTSAPGKLLMNPRLGEKLETFLPREVRRIFVGPYELRYEIDRSTIFVLRLWHTKEHR